MSMASGVRPVTVRLAAALVMTVAAALLLFLDVQSPPRAQSRSASFSPAASGGIQAAVDSMLRRYGISRSAVRTWNVLSREKKVVRVAQQIEVSRDFPSLVFNDQLQRMLEPVEAHVVATERLKDNSVTMHIVCGGRTVRSLVFALTDSPE
jgi:hypothetical protein